MTYAIVIDQEFAEMHELTLVQVCTLAAFITLPTWTKTIAVDGEVWYRYSEEKMAEDFPLLFGEPKRCYKNIMVLCEMGFVQLTKFGKDKYVRFTEKCEDWGRKKKVQNWTKSPKTDENSPKLDQTLIDSTYNNSSNINNSNINQDIAPDGATPTLFPEDKIAKKGKGTTEPLCLFADSRYADADAFCDALAKEDAAGIDIAYYYAAVRDWSAGGGKKKRDWIATARNFMRSDKRDGRLVMVTGIGLSESALRYLADMQAVRV